MTRQRLSERVIGALSLAPMTLPQVARCLCVAEATAGTSVRRLVKRGRVRPHGWSRRVGVNRHVYASALFEVIR